jgi:hypothetical protein
LRFNSDLTNEKTDGKWGGNRGTQHMAIFFHPSSLGIEPAGEIELCLAKRL